MKNRIFLLLCVLTAVFAVSCDKSRQAEEYPMFWTWLGYKGAEAFAEDCAKMNEVGIEGVVLNARSPEEYREAVPIAREHGIKVYSWLITMNLDHGRDSIVKAHPEWLSVNRLGRSLADTTAYVDYYKFLCPALPEVRDYIVDKVKGICEVDGVEGIAIDYHRFVDVVLPTTLWPNYGVIQDREYPEWDFGYHPAMIAKFKELYGYDPREQDDPTQDLKWRQFRCDQITEVANLIAETVHSYGKKMSASPFPTPKMSARMVRQDWGKWDLDIVFPMVYHNFYTIDPAFAYDCSVENVRDKGAGAVLYCGLMYSPEIVACMDEAFRGGAEGICLFTIDGLRTPEQKAEFRAYTDSLKALRAAGGLHPSIIDKADTDPFHHPGTLAQVEKRMQELIAGVVPAGRRHRGPVAEPPVLPALDLGEYTFLGAHDIVRDYKVTDKASGTTFKVSFYLYGDVLSGWNVEKL